jgi:hypothetical protein
MLGEIKTPAVAELFVGDLAAIGNWVVAKRSQLRRLAASGRGRRFSRSPHFCRSALNRDSGGRRIDGYDVSVCCGQTPRWHRFQRRLPAPFALSQLAVLGRGWRNNRRALVGGKPSAPHGCEPGGRIGHKPV